MPSQPLFLGGFGLVGTDRFPEVMYLVKRMEIEQSGETCGTWATFQRWHREIP